MPHTTREEWLAAAVKQMTPLFEAKSYKVPVVRVSCGWPSNRGTSPKKRTIGQCWANEASTDGVNQIFISPWLALPSDPMGVLPTLVHEVVHAVVGLEAKHGKKFSKCAKAVGLEGKMTSTNANVELIAQCEKWVKELGEYPHAKLDLALGPVKKQSTRMVKMECGTCGYIARTSKKWLDEVGPAHCPKHGAMNYEMPGEDNDEESEGEE